MKLQECRHCWSCNKFYPKFRYSCNNYNKPVETCDQKTTTLFQLVSTEDEMKSQGDVLLYTGYTSNPLIVL